MSDALSVRPKGSDLVTGDVARAEVCSVACADLFRGDGEILASAFGVIPAIGARLARATFAPELALTNGESYVVRGTWAIDEPAPSQIEGYLPFRSVFDRLWHGNRHVVMIPSQIDRYGNCNISAIGDFERPTRQLLGVRGAPGNTVSHTTSYWVPRHSPRTFVESVDVVCGVGNDRASSTGPIVTEGHDLRRVVTNLAVLGYRADGTMRLLSVHPGVSVEQVVEATGFDLGDVSDTVETRRPDPEELQLIRTTLDPRGRRTREVPS